MKYAPVVVFAYNRADMLEQLLSSLEKNPNVERMDLYIFVDVPDKKNVRDRRLSEYVIEYVSNYQERSKFKKVTVEIAKKHKGLADSIISGVSKVIKQYGKVIVLEDDLIVSNDFLDYMQRGLAFYRYHPKVWSIGGHCIQMKCLDYYKGDVFLLTKAECLGWATWKNRWEKTDWDVSTYSGFTRNIFKRALFNLGGYDMARMLDKQMKNKEFNSWAIRWSYQQFLERKYTVFPKETRVIHMGNDSRATHGSYVSSQELKKTYKKCKFIELKPNPILILAHKRARDRERKI